MVKKRLIGLITIKNDLAVQSFSYNKYLPIGKPECLIENLDRWGADEILIQVIDRTKKDIGPDFELLKRIGQLKITTPLIYCGGIRNHIDAINVIKHGADRIIVDSLFRRNQKEIVKICESLGSQAIIASLPVLIIDNEIYLFDYEKGTSQIINEELIKSTTNLNLVSEVLLINKEREGFPKSFDTKLIKLFPKTDANLIAFGGISDHHQIKKILNNDRISAIAIGNFLNYKEHSIQLIKESLNLKNVRKPKYDPNI